MKISFDRSRLASIFGFAPDWLAPAFLRKRTFGAAIAASCLAIVYWGGIASDRYVSEAHVIIQKTDLGVASFDFSSLLSGAAGNNRSDLLILRDHLLSRDMLAKLDAKLDLRRHYSDGSRDILSRMWSHDVPQEWFHRYFLKRVGVELDDYSGVLVIKAEGFDPQTAQAVTALLVAEGERAMNEMAHQLAQDQVGFLEEQVSQRANAALAARQAVIEFQNRTGLVSPQSTAENLQGNVNALTGKRIELQAKRSAMLGYLTPQAPAIIDLDLQLRAVEAQIAQEQARLAAPAGQTLNRTVEEFQRLQLAAELAQDAYKTALLALEKGHVEATRTIKKLTTVQTPTTPQYPEEPRRLYNTTVFVLIVGLLAGIVHLVAAIIRDHKD